MVIELIAKYEAELLKRLKLSYKNLSWCELGDQIYYDKTVAKKQYEKLGVNHTSIDINGRNGAIMIDLCKQIPKQFINKFDVITNYGTTEHVENQFKCFENIHYMCKDKGIMIHGVPLLNNWANHCRYYYNTDFFVALSQLCNYEIIDLRVLNFDFYKHPKNLVYAILKNNGWSFIDEAKFKAIPLHDTGNKAKTQNYTKK